MSTAAKQRREAKLLTELQELHGYMIRRVDRERDRYTTQVTGIKTKRMKMTPAVVVKLIVPEASALGKAAVAMYKGMGKRGPARSAKIKNSA